MARNNICIIYDSDEEYAKRLMSVINDDNSIPYNAQVFTKEQDFERYCDRGKADVLMVNEAMYNPDMKKDIKAKLVVLCEDEEEADEINASEESDIVGVCKYQTSYQILHSVINFEKKEMNDYKKKAKFIAVYGGEYSGRLILSFAISRLLSEKSSTLFLNMESFSGMEQFFQGEGQGNISDVFYYFKQNHFQYHKKIDSYIRNVEKLDYISSDNCIEDISDIPSEDMIKLIQSIALEKDYTYIIVNISEQVKAPWVILDCCDNIFIPKNSDRLLDIRNSYMEKYFLESGMEEIVNRFISVVVDNEDVFDNELWKNIVYSKTYQRIQEKMDW